MLLSPSPKANVHTSSQNKWVCICQKCPNRPRHASLPAVGPPPEGPLGRPSPAATGATPRAAGQALQPQGAGGGNELTQVKLYVVKCLYL